MQYTVVVIEQWPEDFNFDITRAINTPGSRHIHEQDSTEGDEDEKKSKEVFDAAEVENDERTMNSILLGCGRRSGSRPRVLLYLLVRSPSHCVLSDPDVIDVNSDGHYDYPYSTSTVLRFDRLWGGGTFL